MSLSNDSRALLEAVRSAHGPTPAQKSRLDAKVLEAVARAPVAGGVSSGLGSGVLLKVVVGLSLLTVAAVIALTIHPERRPDGPESKDVEVPSEASREPPVIVVEAAPEPVAEPSPQPVVRTPAKRRAITVPPPVVVAPPEPVVVPEPPRKTQTGSEISRLQGALTLLRASRWNDALAELDAIERTFPNGLLHVEARAMRAQALCEVGKGDEALAIAGALVASSPKNPAVARLRTTCAAAAFP